METFCVQRFNIFYKKLLEYSYFQGRNDFYLKCLLHFFFPYKTHGRHIQVVCMSLDNYVLGMGGHRAKQSKTTTSESIQVLCLNIHH